jgi:hypothetical protein
MRSHRRAISVRAPTASGWCEEERDIRRESDGAAGLRLWWYQRVGSSC